LGLSRRGRNNIAWIVMHCLENLDEYASGGRVYEYAWCWDLWQCKPEERPQPGDPFPRQAEMLARLHAIREAVVATLARLDEAALTEKVSDHPQKSSRADFYMRTIYHTMAHTRQIWLLRGALGLADGNWPHQHWA
jgi:hypothetical protein